MIEDQAIDKWAKKRDEDKEFHKNHKAKIDAAVKEIAATPMPELDPYPTPKFPTSYDGVSKGIVDGTNSNETAPVNASKPTNVSNATNATVAAAPSNSSANTSANATVAPVATPAADAVDVAAPLATPAADATASVATPAADAAAPVATPTADAAATVVPVAADAASVAQAKSKLAQTPEMAILVKKIPS
jgi:hypothetical protein